MPEFRPSDEVTPKRGEVIAFPTMARRFTDAEPRSHTSRATPAASDTVAEIRARMEEIERRRREDRDGAADDESAPSTPSGASVVPMPGVSGDAELMSEAQDALVRALARAPKSIHEARQYLGEQFEELGALELDRIIERCIALGYLDDFRLAEQLCEGAFRRKSLGRHAKANELRRRGVPNAIIDDVLADEEPDVEYARALELARERVRRARGLDYETARRRIHGYLARRGYSSEIATRAVRAALLDD